MANLTLQDYGDDGQSVTTTAAEAGGDAAPNEGTTLLKLDNSGSSGAVDVTLTASRPDDQGFARDYTYTVGAGAVRWVPAGRRDRFGSRVVLAYPSGIGDGPLQVGAAKVGGLDGLGNDLPAAPALGATPVDVPRVKASDPPDFDTDAVGASTDGNLLANDGDTELWVKNTSGSTVRVWFRALTSSHGFQNHEPMDVENDQLKIGLTLPTRRFGRLVGITFSDTSDTPLGSTSGIELLGVRNAAF